MMLKDSRTFLALALLTLVALLAACAPPATNAPTIAPTTAPATQPTSAPTAARTAVPTTAPTAALTSVPTVAPTATRPAATPTPALPDLKARALKVGSDTTYPPFESVDASKNIVGFDV